jgi:hypothetical protein
METARVAILAPSSKAPSKMGKVLVGKAFGLAVLDILESSVRPSRGKLIFSTLTELDLTGTQHSAIDDYGAIRFLSVVPANAECKCSANSVQQILNLC